MDVPAALAAARRTSDPEARAAALERVCDDAIGCEQVSWPAFVDVYVADAVLPGGPQGLLIGRRVLQHLGAAVRRASHASPPAPPAPHALAAPEVRAETLERVVAACSDAGSFDEALVPIRCQLADTYEAMQRYADAAHVWQALPQELVSRAGVCSWAAACVRVVRLYTLARQWPDAEAAVRRATLAMHAARGDDALSGELAELQARVHAAHHRFSEAAACFYTAHKARGAAETPMLEACAVHAMLAPPSDARTTWLLQLCAEPGLQDWACAPLLARAASMRLVHAQDQAALQPYLEDVHTAPACHGVDAVSWAWALHNVAAAFQLYSAVPLPRLAALANVSPEACEAAIAQLQRGAACPRDAGVDQAAHVWRRSTALPGDAADQRRAAALHALDHALRQRPT